MPKKAANFAAFYYFLVKYYEKYFLKHIWGLYDILYSI